MTLPPVRTGDQDLDRPGLVLAPAVVARSTTVPRVGFEPTLNGV